VPCTGSSQLVVVRLTAAVLVPVRAALALGAALPVARLPRRASPRQAPASCCNVRDTPTCFDALLEPFHRFPAKKKHGRRRLAQVRVACPPCPHYCLTHQARVGVGGRGWALASGGKDSCFNLLHCIVHGHTVLAVAHLAPPPGTGQSSVGRTVAKGAVLLTAQAQTSWTVTCTRRSDTKRWRPWHRAWSCRYTRACSTAARSRADATTARLPETRSRTSTHCWRGCRYFPYTVPLALAAF
jgi:hypothetical protein